MDREQVEELMNSGSLPGTGDQLSLKETHISWVILTRQYAFKIKRPVKYSFLDFSSLAGRKYYCREELRLNKRFAPEMYLKVLPVTGNMLKGTNDAAGKEIVDFAVQMKRMDNKREMDNLLRSDKVTDKHIDKLAEKIAGFHKRVNVIKKAFDKDMFQKKYADIKSVVPYLKKTNKRELENKINACIERSGLFIRNNEKLLVNRINNGYHKDCHGDLNTRNIFLYDDPVIFDCIEFNQEFRQIDILSDIAFLCVDFDFFGKKNFSELFYHKYCEYFGEMERSDTRRLFAYYKSYRANVRAKVTLISAEKAGDNDNAKLLDDAGKYVDLMETYTGSF